MTTRQRGVAAVAVLAAAYVGSSGLLAWATSGVVGQVTAPGPAGLDASVGLAAAVVAWTVLSWLTATTLLAVLATALSRAGSRLPAAADRFSPVLARRIAAGLLGAGLAGAPLLATPPALAADLGRGPRAAVAIADAPHPSPVLPSLDRPVPDLAGWTPDRPAGPARTRTPAPVRLVTAAPHAEQAVADELVVRSGDSLWDIAARHLGPQASAAEVAAEWPRWHAANREVIGPDPDLLLPGQRLVPPRC